MNLDLTSGCWALGAFDSIIVIGDQKHTQTHFIDIARGKSVTLDAFYAVNVDRHRSGRWLLVGNASGAITLDDPFADLSPTPLPAFSDERRAGFANAHFLGDRVVLWPSSRHPFPFTLPVVPWVPVVMVGDEYRPATELPSVESKASPRIEWGLVRLGDGADVFIWQNAGYELEGDRFVCTFPISFATSYEDWSAVAVGTDGFFYLSDRKLFEVHRGKDPIAHLPKLDNIMGVAPGPDGRLLLRMGVNKRRNPGLIYNPTDGKVVRIEKTVFDRKTVDLLCYVPETRMLAAFSRGLLTAPL